MRRTPDPPGRPAGAPGDEDRRLLAGAALAYGALFVLWVALRPGPAGQREVLSDLAPLPIGLAAWVTAWRTGRGAGEAGRAWRRIGLSFLLWWAGDLLWFLQEAVLHRTPFPSPADLFYLCSYPMLASGLLALPGAPRRPSERAKAALDALTVLLAGAMVVWYLVVGPLVHGGGVNSLATVLNVAYPVGDLVLVFGVAAVLLGRRWADRPLWLLLAGVLALVVADVAYARLSLTGAYRGGDWPDAAWMAAQCLFVVAAVAQRRQADRPAVRVPRPVAGVSHLPYAAVALGYGLLFVVGRREAAYPLDGLLVCAAAITAVVMTRQIRVTAENTRLLAQLRQLAEVDGLTATLNRRSLFETGEPLVARAAHAGRPLTVLMIDLDHFKAVNDTFGHAAGDEVLAEVARRMRLELRDADVVGRYGGDELAAVLPDCTAGEGLEVAERIRASVAAAPVTTADGWVSVSLSIGVAEATGQADLTAVLARADAALYQAKAAGRGCTKPAA
ncbi:MAG TPA: GGDEF domain-containing protein [Acidimicrobiales bacterium]|nr:GGDEF domain-containing protein [Acidimicrobiales bacterium]